MAPSPPSTPQFDWQSEQAGQKRDLTRFAGELGRLLSLRGSSATAKKAAVRVRERWDHLVRRLEARFVRGRDVWDRQTEELERLQSKRAILDALVSYDEALAPAADIEAVLDATLRTITLSVPVDGALVELSEFSAQTRRASTRKRQGRDWPPVADRELARHLLSGAGDGSRISIEGRPVRSSPREQNRVAHWLAVGITHGSDTYGAFVVGRRATEDAFGDHHATALEAIAGRLGRALAARVGVGVRPILGAGPKPEGFEHLWGESPAFRRALAMAARFALSDSPVLIEGELGTGCETLARALHGRSPRADQPFVVFRGADLPPDIVARQLFGIAETASDGAVSEHPGDLELASGGTLFVDEIAAIDVVSQVRLLRFLNEGTFERVGDRSELKADVRLVMATTANMEEAVARGRVREDLYYLITAARIPLPPLRERAGDIVELSRRFAVAAGEKAGKEIQGIDADAARLLASAPFPGNVRQLAQVIERAVYLTAGPLVGVADLPPEISAHVVAATVDSTTWVEQAARAIRAAVAAGSAGHYEGLRDSRKTVVGAVEAAFVASVHKAVGAHPSRAARHCGIHRAQWWRLLRGGGAAVVSDSESEPSVDTGSDVN